MMTIETQVSKLTSIPLSQVEAAVRLLDEGNTLPFIARYRKEMTGGLTDEQLEHLFTALTRTRAMEERKEAVIKSLQEQGVWTDALEKSVRSCATLAEVEDVYAPFKPKRKTRASIAREKGLQDLADAILRQPSDLPAGFIARFLNDAVSSEDEALAGARDILAEMIADTPLVRSRTRELAMRSGMVQATRNKKVEDPKGTYQDYYEFALGVGRLKPHQVLALNRAESEKIIHFKLDVPEEEWKRVVSGQFPIKPRSPFGRILQEAIDDSGERLLLPAIERDVRSALTEQAETHAITVFADNLRHLILTPPITGNVVMGIDPGFRTGCKVAVVDPTGKVLATLTIYPHEPQREKEQAARLIAALIQKFGVNLISIGNGTASHETEALVADVIKAYPQVKYLITNEAGASVYSASELARKEMPDLDVSMRGAVSIARRVQDPLAELVKIDPKSIGVGMYQHDVNQKQLSETLERVVTSVVAQVGVDANTASPALLTYVPGIGAKLAGSVVAYRDEHGPYRSRRALKKVSGMGERAFQQSAGFLLIHGGDEPLDGSTIHPENYPAAQNLLKLADVNMKMSAAEKKQRLDALRKQSSLADLAELLEIGEPTLKDILDQLLQPGRDPRQDLSKPVLRDRLLSLEELKPGMGFTGTVRNVTDFGAFVDIGLKKDVLLHKSRFPRGQVLKVGEVLHVVIETIDLDRERVGVACES